MFEGLQLDKEKPGQLNCEHQSNLNISQSTLKMLRVELVKETSVFSHYPTQTLQLFKQSDWISKPDGINQIKRSDSNERR